MIIITNVGLIENEIYLSHPGGKNCSAIHCVLAPFFAVIWHENLYYDMVIFLNQGLNYNTSKSNQNDVWKTESWKKWEKKRKQKIMDGQTDKVSYGNDVQRS